MSEAYEKNIIKLSEEQAIESQEHTELKRNFAKELRKPENGSYLNKLRTIGAAFALAGITVFAPYQQKEAIAPETTREYVIAKSGADLEKEAMKDLELFIKVNKALEERGGIAISDILESTYKVMPEITGRLAKENIARGEVPYFSKPEIILGNEFIKKYPKESKKYMKDISNVMKATVLIKSPANSFGSGVLIDLDGEIIVLTNAHVIKNFDEVKVSLINGETLDFKQAYQNGTLDLGILRSKQKIRNNKTLAENGAKALNKNNIDFGALNEKEKLAFVGHPIGFIYEVGIAEASGSTLVEDKSPVISENGYAIKRNFNSIDYKADPRFSKLATFRQGDDMPDLKKGFGIPGLSGGPVISLERGGKLVGINAFGNTDLMINPLLNADQAKYHGGAVSGEEIERFLKDYQEFGKTQIY